MIPRRTLGLGLALALGLAAPTASAQPAPRPAQPARPAAAAQPVPAPAQPPAGTQPAPPEAAEPPGDEPLMPPQASPPAALGPVVPGAPAPAPGAAPPPAATAERPTGRGDIGATPSEVYAEDWWSHARPAIELHGYYRVRAEFFHNFALGRRDAPGQQLWPQPPDNDYVDIEGNRHQVALCGDDPLPPNPTEAQTLAQRCDSNTQAGANMRFRINPELHISDNLRIMSQIDMLDNIVLGSTPEGYNNRPGASGYQVVGRGGYSPLGAFASTQWAPSAGQNAQTDSIVVKRVWGEYLTPIGLLRFGRMPNQWGLGILANSGDGYDSDYQSTVDRLMLVTGIKQYDIYFAAGWDFTNEGATSSSLNEQQGQPHDLAQGDDVDQFVFVAVRRKNPELQKLELARGNVVMNGGVYFTYRNQSLANDEATPGTAASLGQASENVSQGLVRRGAEAFTPDIWFQFLYKKFRFELEAVMSYGSLENTESTGGIASNYNNLVDESENGWNIRQFGLATQTEFRALEDRLRIHFGFGYATGDDDIDSLAPHGEGLQPQRTADRTYSEFRFHPDYRVDLILFRHILSRVQGAYYFRPGVEYDFARDKNGQRLGGGAAVIWSRAAEFVQTPGHARDLGLELNFKLYFQSKDGAINDDADKMGGFFTSLEYGVMFPLGGFSYLPREKADYQTATGIADLDTDTAQTVRWFLGILF